MSAALHPSAGPTAGPAAGPTGGAATRLDLGLAALLSLLGVAVTAWITTRLGDGRMPLAGDAHYVWLAARSIAFDGDLDLTNQYAQHGDKWGLGRWPAADGTRFPPRELGPSLLMVPGLALQHTLQVWRDTSGAPADWIRSPAAEVWLATVPAAASLGPLYLALRRLVGHALAAAVHSTSRLHATLALAATLGFVPAFYAVGHAGYAHAPDAVACAWLMVALVERRSTAACGGLLAIALLMRLQNALWLLWPLTDVVRAYVVTRRGAGDLAGVKHAIGRLLALAGVASLGLAPQVVLALCHPGSTIGPIRWGLDFFDVAGLARGLPRVLAGVHGLWTWTPLAAVATVGLFVALRRARNPADPPPAGSPPAGPRDEARLDAARLAGPASLVAAALILLVSTVPDPDGGDAFGARRLAGLTPILALGLAYAASDGPPSTTATAARRSAEPPHRVWIVTGLAALLAAANVGWVALALAGALSLRP